MKNLKSLFNTGLGCAAATMTVFGMTMENPYLITTGINLGISGGVATFLCKKSQLQQREDQISTKISYLSNQIEAIENQTQQQQQEFNQYQQTLQNLELQQSKTLQTLQSQQQQNIQGQNQLSFAIGNAQRQLNNHNKKLKQQQQKINTQKSHQNKVTSDLQKIKNQQQTITTNHSKYLGKIEDQVDKLIEIASNNSTESITSPKPNPQKKVFAPVVYRKPQTLCYIDNNNLFNCLKAMGIEPDYKALLLFLTSKTGKTQIKLYDGFFPGQKYKYAHLKQLGYQIHTLPLVKRGKDKFKTVGDDVQLAIDMIKDVKSGDSVILVTGDGDLFPAVEEIKQRNVYVTLIAQNSSVNNDLRKLADKFINLESIKYDIANHTKFIA